MYQKDISRINQQEIQQKKSLNALDNIKKLAQST